MFSRLMMAWAPPSLMNCLTGSMILEAKRMNSAWGRPGRISRRLILRKWKSWARSIYVRSPSQKRPSMSRAWGEKPIDTGLIWTNRASSLAMRSLTLLLKAGCSALYIEAILKATRMARAMERMSSSLSVGMGTDGAAGAQGSAGPGAARSSPEDMVHLNVKKTLAPFSFPPVNYHAPGAEVQGVISHPP